MPVCSFWKPFLPLEEHLYKHSQKGNIKWPLILLNRVFGKHLKPACRVEMSREVAVAVLSHPQVVPVCWSDFKVYSSPAEVQLGALPAYTDSGPQLQYSEQHLHIVVLPVSGSTAAFDDRHSRNRSVDHSPDSLMLGLVHCWNQLLFLHSLETYKYVLGWREAHRRPTLSTGRCYVKFEEKMLNNKTVPAVGIDWNWGRCSYP